MKKEDAILGMEVVVPKYGVGRITALNVGGRISVTPHVPLGRTYEMHFDPHNVRPWVPAAG